MKHSFKKQKQKQKLNLNLIELLGWTSSLQEIQETEEQVMWRKEEVIR